MSSNYAESFQNFSESWIDYVKNWNNLVIKYNSNLADSISRSFDENNAMVSSLQSNDMRFKMRKSFDDTFRDEIKKEDFIESISKAMDSWFELSEYYGINKSYQIFVDLFSSWNKLLEPLRDNWNRTDSEIIRMDEDYHLLHYKSDNLNKKTPILIVYSLINRHYILDLLPKVSVVKHFINAGYDVYATDWETPSNFEKDMTLEHYIHVHVENAVNKVLEITGSEKVTLFGYCWGGIFSLIFSAMHPHLVRNLILHATPLDLKKPDTVIEKWTQKIKPDVMVEKFGNVPGQLLNLVFSFRNPLETILKYPNYFQRPRTVDEIKQFFAIEGWLYDSRPISGRVYSEIIKKIYQQNELVQGKMKVGEKIVNLSNLTMPVLNIVGTNDDLVPPDSSKSVMCDISSSDKELIEFPTGHVGLCISNKAHKELWPKVVDWINKRS